ncbi:hypothetical protein AFIC_003100 [[Pseudomonas] carboxydohydrogena]|uniref:Replication-associated protein ORF2/G2P domain-containing protein n=1 Tax=Afipia carboxydohydrogena TaxID=290 RepID=A0ABY8BPQ1_AFICR|nr:hypothetical protein [[Pseudomonas] carboxydohydrogena]WEF51506.1 hypothetical protein AFIC_003100 [[Pseudomonas] carboxydohydrogena]
MTLFNDNPFGTAAKPSRFISEAEFAAVYAAADFAAAFDLCLDTSVTITWRDFGVQAPEEVQAAFERFEKCLRDWLTRRTVPMAYIYCHERGARVGLHTHLNLFVPNIYRNEFKVWAASYTRRCGRGGLMVSTPPIETMWLHWWKVGYICKGYDRQQVVQDARSSVDGRTVYLGDLIPVAWRDPGVIDMKQRVGCSRSLDRSARARGIPGGVVDVAERGGVIDISGVRHRFPASPRKPFRSRYEDGCRDVRKLYGDDLFARVTGISTSTAVPVMAAPTAVEEDLELPPF